MGALTIVWAVVDGLFVLFFLAMIVTFVAFLFRPTINGQTLKRHQSGVSLIACIVLLVLCLGLFPAFGTNPSTPPMATTASGSASIENQRFPRQPIDPKVKAALDAYSNNLPPGAPRLLDCGQSDAAMHCDAEQAGFVQSLWPKANRGDIVAARNLADCLSTGCSGAVEVNQIAGCAWMLAITDSGSPAVIDWDSQHLRMLCGQLDPVAKQAAIARAVQMPTIHFYRADDD